MFSNGQSETKTTGNNSFGKFIAIDDGSLVYDCTGNVEYCRYVEYADMQNIVTLHTLHCTMRLQLQTIAKLNTVVSLQQNNLSGCFTKEPNYQDLKHESSIAITCVENNVIPCAN
ncbi:hypothetical protein T4A_2334 [Trichinella pseudospiralis]|uniref:Uncharacterized protein n=1 Tax=Trichinella pseudospiralis TaxID=6337 RepID=A0A0V1ESN3_TRIPS|nr:hypothetical protein T4A_2334 [Trichinella pseudospiralis]